jgi:hypothetical protein
VMTLNSLCSSTMSNAASLLMMFLLPQALLLLIWALAWLLR